uniref:DM13 domain-containing protein n=1 Tax=Panagrellus redivivus TaxID=6233 RepID=A0A7E4VXG4_PANRE
MARSPNVACYLAMRLLFVYFCLIINFARPESVEEDPDEYYGVPLGALHYSAAGTSAEVYAADEFTVVFNHFTHHPRQLGCTAMMIGPPRPEDIEDVIPGHGILISIAQPLMVRVKRQFGMWQVPRQLGHLFMQPGDEENRPTNINTEGSFSGIHIQRNQETQPAKDITIKATTESTTTPSTTTTEATTTSTMASTTTETEIETETETTTVTEPTTTTEESTTTSAPESTSTSTSTVETTEVVTSTHKPLILFENKTRPVSNKPQRVPITRWSSSESGEGPGIMVMSEEERHYRKPNNVNPRFFGPLSRQEVKEVHLSTDLPTILRRKLPEESEIRRAPARKTFNNNDNKADGTWNLLSASTVGPDGSTPMFWVIPDPHEARRQERLQLLRDGVTSTARPTTTKKPVPLPINPRFELPRITDKAAAFTLTNGAQVTDYLWIGLYNQCDQTSIPLVSLKNIDPPREERISPISGWSHNVTSYRVQILNCNTVLIPGFVFIANDTTPNTYFYAGIGDFPHNIQKQVRIEVIGHSINEPLRTYNGEDVLLRLPKSYRTFDIDFISIYNEDADKSYGHVIIPSLLVPPCAED